MAIKKCFVCGVEKDDKDMIMNELVMFYVCGNCQGSEAEKNRENELLDGLAEGLVCGCI